MGDATGQVGPQQGASKATGSGDADVGEYVGTIKSYNQEKGFGFIVSPGVKAQGYESDVFLPPDTIGGFSVGSTVSFTAYLRDGKLRAKDLTEASESATKLPMEGLPGLLPPPPPPRVVLPPSFDIGSMPSTDVSTM